MRASSLGLGYVRASSLGLGEGQLLGVRLCECQ